MAIFHFSNMVAIHHLRFVMRVWTTHEGHLAVFINVQNFVEINTALSTSFNILRLRLELKFTPPKLGVWGKIGERVVRR